MPDPLPSLSQLSHMRFTIPTHDSAPFQRSPIEATSPCYGAVGMGIAAIASAAARSSGADDVGNAVGEVVNDLARKALA